MTRLMISVRSAAEAEVAISAGADWIDVKEPSRGALGAADANVWTQVAQVVNGRTGVSAALGELVDWTGERTLPTGCQVAKLGLSECIGRRDWQALWRSAQSALAPVGLAAVAYADHRTARSPSVKEVLEFATSMQCTWLLIDTFDKSTGDLLQHVTIEELTRWIRLASEHAIQMVLAGSLTTDSLTRVSALQPAMVAVRGAACDAGRESALSGSRVAQLVRLLDRPVHTIEHEM